PACDPITLCLLICTLCLTPSIHPSIHPSQRGLQTSSYLALSRGSPWRIPLPLTGVLSSHDLVPRYSKSIPTIRGPGEQVLWGLDSVRWEHPISGVLVVPPG
ncbi:unnamed protein product, partial [Staurois parvus]